MRDERVAADLATLGDRGRAASAAAHERWASEHPTEPCPDCFGGSFVERAGARRPFDHRSFSREAGDRYEASCPTCRGGGKLRITPARAAYLARRALRDQRRAYRVIRRTVCAEHELGREHFDRLVRKRLPAAPSPAAFLAAAFAVAAFFGGT